MIEAPLGEGRKWRCSQNCTGADVQSDYDVTMSEASENVFLDPTHDSVVALFSRNISGPITMLNLLRLRAVADYSADPELAPTTPITGRQAYDRYVAHTLPYLTETGGKLSYLGEGGTYLIGPEDEGWDLVMLVQQNSLEDFLSFAEHGEYLKGIGHRTAAVWDSRILPLVDVAL